MKNYIKIATGILLTTLALSGFSKTGWLSDDLVVYLRDNPSNQYETLEILHAGEKLEEIPQSKSSTFAQVKVSSGKIGWINKKYIMSEPVAWMKLEKLQEEFELLTAEHNEYINVHKDTLKELEEKKALKKELAELKSKYNSLTLLSSKQVALDSENSQLLKDKSMLESTLEKVQIELAAYKANNATRAWITGAALVCLGIILCLIIINIPKKNSRKDGWS